MPSLTRIFWQPLDEADGDVLWTLGWIPDSSALRWSLSSAARLEGLRSGWMSALEAAEGAYVWEGYVGINDDGDTIEVNKAGETAGGEVTSDVVAATLARLGSLA